MRRDRRLRLRKRQLVGIDEPVLLPVFGDFGRSHDELFELIALVCREGEDRLVALVVGGNVRFDLAHRLIIDVRR